MSKMWVMAVFFFLLFVIFTAMNANRVDWRENNACIHISPGRREAADGGHPLEGTGGTNKNDTHVTICCDGDGVLLTTKLDKNILNYWILYYVIIEATN